MSCTIPKLNLAHCRGVLWLYAISHHLSSVAKSMRGLLRFVVFFCVFFLLQVQITFVRKMVCGLCWCGCPSWPPENRVWRKSFENTGPSLDVTTSAGNQLNESHAFIICLVNNLFFDHLSLSLIFLF